MWNCVVLMWRGALRRRQLLIVRRIVSSRVLNGRFTNVRTSPAMEGRARTQPFCARRCTPQCRVCMPVVWLLGRAARIYSGVSRRWQLILSLPAHLHATPLIISDAIIYDARFYYFDDADALILDASDEYVTCRRPCFVQTYD